MEMIFRISAMILAGIAAYFLWQKNGDGAFIAAVVGAVCFFISVRFQVKGRLNEREAAREKRGNAEMQGHGDGENFDSPNALNDIAANERINEQSTTNREQSTTNHEQRSTL
ncbi:MAG: hypothetical protein LUM44_21455 [Pyrinomonadaceae bacterium]|nr:hypothetical protein [Pyrinomonadaceae bacterium]